MTRPAPDWPAGLPVSPASSSGLATFGRLNAGTKCVVASQRPVLSEARPATLSRFRRSYFSRWSNPGSTDLTRASRIGQHAAFDALASDRSVFSAPHVLCLSTAVVIGDSPDERLPLYCVEAPCRGACSVNVRHFRPAGWRTPSRHLYIPSDTRAASQRVSFAARTRPRTRLRRLCRLYASDMNIECSSCLPVCCEIPSLCAQSTVRRCGD